MNMTNSPSIGQWSKTSLGTLNGIGQVDHLTSVAQLFALHKEIPICLCIHFLGSVYIEERECISLFLGFEDVGL